MSISKGPGYAPVSSSDEFFKGEDQQLRFTVSTVPTGDVTDVTGWTTSLKIANTQGAAAVVTKAGVVTSGVGGILTVSLLAADTASVTPGTLWYDLSRTDSGSNQVIAYGPCEVLARNT